MGMKYDLHFGCGESLQSNLAAIIGRAQKATKEDKPAKQSNHQSAVKKQDEKPSIR